MLKRTKKTLQVRKILVPADFSPYSNQAVDYAAMIAKTFKANIILMHVTEAFPYTVPDTLIVVEGWPTLDKFAQARLDEVRKKLVTKGLVVKTYLTRGTPYREIVKKAAQEEADMIVMGTHGRRGVDHLLLGSVAEKVVRLAGCPVLTVRPTSEVQKGWERTKRQK